MLVRSNVCRRGADQGAAAVEFALVVPILVFLLFGIVDYGLYFTNSLTVRAGASDAARQIAVGNFSADCADDSAGGDSLDALILKVEDCLSPVAGVADAKVTYPEGGAAGDNVIVCAAIRVDGVTGITPMPANHLVTARVAMPLQQGPPTIPVPLPVDEQANPTEPDWFEEWC